jgi:hypothetical protein
VIITDDKVEIRYVLPTSPDGPHPPYCQLRKDHLHPPAAPGHPHQGDRRQTGRAGAEVVGQLPGAKAPAEGMFN